MKKSALVPELQMFKWSRIIPIQQHQALKNGQFYQAL